MNRTARSERYHIGIYGRRNIGKSSLINSLAGQEVSIVSNIAGTTTDTVWKNMELPDIGAAVLADTAGYDDCGTLGEKRVNSARQSTERIDLALLLIDGNSDDATYEKKWLQHLESLDIPVICLLGKADIQSSNNLKKWVELLEREVLPISSQTGAGIDTLLCRMAAIYKSGDNISDITHQLAKNGDTVVLVMPQDSQAPQGRLIQPQVQTLRNLLDKQCLAMCCTPEKLPTMLSNLESPPALIITDSQVFPEVERLAPRESKLTSFSILMARHKGDIEEFRKGAEALLNLPHDGHILIAEACSHIPQNEDIGRVKLPRLLRKKFGDGIKIDIVSGNDFPDELSPYDIIIHCGACMFTRRHVLTRVRMAKTQNIPITNYGIAIAALTGILNKVEI
jgi:[FeFe] hydrogenase H-cluster maturation GTPase HydF